MGEPGWPHREFMDYLRALMDAAGVSDHVELYRRADVAQSVFSRWERGETQPGRANLRKIAAVLGVAPGRLFVAAGLMNGDELETTGDVDIATLPAEFRDLIELWPGLKDDQRKYARRVISHLVAGLRAELDKPQVKPTGRRRSA